MSPLLKMLAALAILSILGWIVMPYLDHDQSKVVFYASFVMIALAYYSIFDLQKKRNEGFIHTLDRLLRATFVAMTLVFVVEIAFTQAAKGTTSTEDSDRPPCLTLGQELDALADGSGWNKAELEAAVERQLKGWSLKGNVTVFRRRQPESVRSFNLQLHDGAATIEPGP